MLKMLNSPRSAMLALGLVSLALAACGGSSTSTTTTSSTTASTSEASSATTSASSNSPTRSTSTNSTSTKASAAKSNSASSSNKNNSAPFAAYKAALGAYAACMRSHGVDLKPPVTTASGLPVLGSPKNVSNKSPQFAGALTLCRPYVIAITRVSPTGTLGG